MLTCYYYKLFAPTKSDYQFDEFTKPEFEITVENENYPAKLALFTENGHPILSRIILLNLKEEIITKEIDEMVYSLNQHLLSVVRLSGLPDITFFPNPIWYFVAENQPHKNGIGIEQHFGTNVIDYQLIKRGFVGSINNRVEIRLLIDGLDQHVPLQYRFLSLYKILEKFFKKDGGWDSKELENAFDPFKQQFETIKISNSNLLNFLHDLRDQCAHIKIGKGKREKFGVAHLNYEGASKVEKFLPIISQVCFDEINRRNNSQFVLKKRD